MRIVSIFPLLLALSTCPAFAQTTQRCFVGYAYHLQSGAFAYTETHQQTLKSGNPVTWNVTYRDPQGNTIATKTMHFGASRFVPVYRLEILADGYVEGIGHDGGWAMYRRQNADAPVQTETFEIEPPIAGDAGFHPFVQAHFEALMSGQTVAFSFAVAGRLSVIDMQAERIEDTTFEGRPAVQFKAGLDMFLVSWFVDPIVLVYDPESRRLLEYRGISNMHDASGEPYPVRVSYYTTPPQADRAADYCGGM